MYCSGLCYYEEANCPLPDAVAGSFMLQISLVFMRLVTIILIFYIHSPLPFKEKHVIYMDLSIQTKSFRIKLLNLIKLLWPR
jgi:hypothetical protein